MQTMQFNADEDQDGRLLVQAATLLREGALVAFPTETVYGLGANALDEGAVARIFEAKGRPSDNPLIVHIADHGELESLVASVPEVARVLMDAFWPGALTLLFRKSDRVPSIVTAGLDTVGVRMPVHPVALELIRKAGVPVAAPSANRSGRPSPTTAAHVREDLQGRIPMIVDGGACQVGVESTVLDVTVDPPMILRPGGVTREMLEDVIGPVAVDPALTGESSRPRAPGMKYAHYAPRAPLTLYAGDAAGILPRILADARHWIGKGSKVGILCTHESMDAYLVGLAPQTDMVAVLPAGRRGDARSVAAGVFAALRRFDEERVDVILAEGFDESGVGHAVMNRLRKAAGGHVVDCGGITAVYGGGSS